MKEATGELNATLVVVLTIGLLSTFFFTVIWPRLRDNLHQNSKCSEAICAPVCEGNPKKCKPNCTDSSCKYVHCVYKKQKMQCPYKG